MFKKAVIVLITLFILGGFKGWDGKTVVKLSDGTRWKQIDFLYCKDLMYRPKVKLYKGRFGMKIKVLGSDCDPAMVKEVK